MKSCIRGRLIDHVRRLGKVSPDKKYELAARIASWRGDAKREIGDLYLKAAWCSDDFNNAGNAKYYRMQAIAHLELTILEEMFLPDDLLIYMYFVGENYRRLGLREKALYWFDQVIGMAQEMNAIGMLELALQQKANPKEYIRDTELSAKSITNILKGNFFSSFLF